MAQAEQKQASINSQIHFQIQAPEVATPQVLVKGIEAPGMERDESPIISKKLRKLFNKVKLNAKITEEVKCIKYVKANIDTKVFTHVNNLPYY